MAPGAASIGISFGPSPGLNGTTRDPSGPAPGMRRPPSGFTTTSPEPPRSEERRVGKECRSRWAPYQAEDGIRDKLVTGVQTCALPIFVAADLVVHGAGPARDGARSGFDRNFLRAVARVEWHNQGPIRAGTRNAQAPVGFHDDFARAAQIGRASCRERV